MSLAGSHSVNDDKKVLNINFDGGKITFDKKSGELISYVKNNCEFININPATCKKGFVPNLVRASLDNDSYGQKKPWDIIKLHDADIVLDDFRFVDKSIYLHQNLCHTCESEYYMSYQTFVPRSTSNPEKKPRNPKNKISYFRIKNRTLLLLLNQFQQKLLTLLILNSAL